ncbi:Regulatory protein ArsR [Nostocoides australiense Ben110]|uniref:Regulatory protein ArsR n=1 Tax=Nostocoides australiense Ben110 TaxID=1193182 RepID=W6JUG4_9MICO|nr:helix-turn-helix domain-containing protein [Tetrasphaera australiensis]CCH72552.1 Regulatory protein ArsR [Tetrasphaera australiensis Ben110]
MQLDADAIKVLAHPLRSRLLRCLRADGPGTATGLAKTLGTDTGTTSYHLRKLASVRLVEQVPSRSARTRWWAASTRFHSWDDEAATDADARESLAWLRAQHVRNFVIEADAWLATHDTWPMTWRRLVGPSDYAMEMTPEQHEQLMSELSSVIERHHKAAQAANAPLATQDPSPQDRPRRVRLYLYNFPVGAYPEQDK